jgi:endonuclease YncB( thermonuclease family)
MTRWALLGLAAIAAIAAVAHAMVSSHTAPPVPPAAKGAWAPTIHGPARVVDSDTVEVAGTRVRLKGVDAAELRTARGEEAKRVMIGIVGKDILNCRLTGEKTYSREAGYCVTVAGVDIKQAIIASGAALACPRYDTRYVAFETAAARAVQPRSHYCVVR